MCCHAMRVCISNVIVRSLKTEQELPNLTREEIHGCNQKVGKQEEPRSVDNRLIANRVNGDRKINAAVGG